ncbi:hypothetical protein BKI52_33255 [marine bacterium AO1-C]|nr:hypothetical protein BKI52_33255 [marine bacterium AO1-C]
MFDQKTLESTANEQNALTNNTSHLNHKPADSQQSPYQTREGKLGSVQAKQQPIQAKQRSVQAKQRPVQKNNLQANQQASGTPAKEAQVKANVGALTGVDVSDAQVHYNSNKPAQLKAEAYAQGNEVHLASGKEAHLGHELAHVVQQKQGRVQPTIQGNNGVGVNNDPKLEHEADVIGAQAMQAKTLESGKPLQQLPAQSSSTQLVAQCNGLVKDRLNVVGETHDESNARRVEEKAFCKEQTGSSNYWGENQFRAKHSYTNSKVPFADPFVLRIDQFISFAIQYCEEMKESAKEWKSNLAMGKLSSVYMALKGLKDTLKLMDDKQDGFELSTTQKSEYAPLKQEIDDNMHLIASVNASVKEYQYDEEKLESFVKGDGLFLEFEAWLNSLTDFRDLKDLYGKQEFSELSREISQQRSEAMHEAANRRNKAKGVWKIGEKHRQDLEGKADKKYNLVSKEEFYKAGNWEED